MTTPLPFTCQHEHYAAGVEDEYGNNQPGWVEPVDVPCFWWSETSRESSVESAGGVRTLADVCLVVDISLEVDPRDVFTVNGRRFEVIGLPKEFDHGPYSFHPNRQVVELKWVG